MNSALLQSQGNGKRVLKVHCRYLSHEMDSHTHYCTKQHDCGLQHGQPSLTEMSITKYAGWYLNLSMK